MVDLSNTSNLKEFFEQMRANKGNVYIRILQTIAYCISAICLLVNSGQKLPYPACRRIR